MDNPEKKKHTTPPAKAIAGLEAHGADVDARQDPTEKKASKEISCDSDDNTSSFP